MMRKEDEREMTACLWELMNAACCTSKITRFPSLTFTRCLAVPAEWPFYSVLTEGKGWVELNSGQWVIQAVQSSDH